MPKSNFLLVDLNESKTKKLAETITSNTSRKILNHLAEKEHDTEKTISDELKLPISTVHYHLQKLMEAKLIEVQEFHYSQKGREVNHYKLANKYIIIAPKKVSGLREKLKGILPVAIASLGIGAVIKFVQDFGSFRSISKDAVMQPAMESVASEALRAGAEEAEKAAVDSVAREAPIVIEKMVVNQPGIAFWFLVGSFSAIFIYFIVMMIRERK